MRGAGDPHGSGGGSRRPGWGGWPRGGPRHCRPRVGMCMLVAMCTDGFMYLYNYVTVRCPRVYIKLSRAISIILDSGVSLGCSPPPRKGVRGRVHRPPSVLATRSGLGSSPRRRIPDVFPRFVSGMSCDPSFSLVRPTLLFGPGTIQRPHCGRCMASIRAARVESARASEGSQVGVTRRAALSCRTMSNCATLHEPKWLRCHSLG